MTRMELERELEVLRLRVLEAGRKSRDKTTVRSMLRKLSFGRPLADQAARDAVYKYYDALCMWMGQAQYWSTEDLVKLLELGRNYLKKMEVRNVNK